MEETPTTLSLKPVPPPDQLLPKTTVSPLGIGLITLGGLILLLVIVRLLKRPKPVDPKAIRREALAKALQALHSATPQNPREAATLASLEVRRYLATVTGDPALYETHEELISRHDALKDLPADARDTSVRIFDQFAALKYSSATASGDPSPVLASGRSLLETYARTFA